MHALKGRINNTVTQAPTAHDGRVILVSEADDKEGESAHLSAQMANLNVPQRTSTSAKAKLARVVKDILNPLLLRPEISTSFKRATICLGTHEEYGEPSK